VHVYLSRARVQLSNLGPGMNRRPPRTIPGAVDWRVLGTPREPAGPMRRCRDCGAEFEQREPGASYCEDCVQSLGDWLRFGARKQV
jgi:hypothetical protein